MTKSTQWTPWAGGECPVHSETVVRVCDRLGHTYKSPAKWVTWKTRTDPQRGVVAYQVVPPAAQARELAFYNAGYEAGLDDDGDRNPYWGDGPSITPLDEIMSEQADAKWARPFRVAATATAWAFIDVGKTDYNAYVEGHEAGFRDTEQDTPELPPWEYGLCTA